MGAPAPVVFGCSGTELSADEIDLFQELRPAGLILFARNCREPDQVRALVRSFRSAVADDRAFVFIDQEGGRVARLGPPHWRRAPPARLLGEIYGIDPERGRRAAEQNTRLIAAELTALGINGNCIPVLDLPAPDGHEIIGDRAFADDPDTAIALGRIVTETLLRCGCLPVIKHIPGHGRARVDSHEHLPVVDCGRDALEAHDFRPFHALHDSPCAMTAHVLYADLDAERCATHSALVINDVIRGRIGFSGLLISDDLAMAALDGGLAERASRALQAGCDLALHCTGDIEDMKAVAEGLPEIAPETVARLGRAHDMIRRPEPFERPVLEREFAETVSEAGLAWAT